MNSVAVWSVLECFRNSSVKVSLATDYIPRLGIAGGQSLRKQKVVG